MPNFAVAADQSGHAADQTPALSGGVATQGVAPLPQP